MIVRAVVVLLVSLASARVNSDAKDVMKRVGASMLVGGSKALAYEAYGAPGQPWMGYPGYKPPGPIGGPNVHYNPIGPVGGPNVHYSAYGHTGAPYNPPGPVGGYNMHYDPPGPVGGYNMHYNPPGPVGGYNMHYNPPGPVGGYNMHYNPPGPVGGHNMHYNPPGPVGGYNMHYNPPGPVGGPNVYGGLPGVPGGVAMAAALSPYGMYRRRHSSRPCSGSRVKSARKDAYERRRSRRESNADRAKSAYKDAKKRQKSRAESRIERRKSVRSDARRYTSSLKAKVHTTAAAAPHPVAAATHPVAAASNVTAAHPVAAGQKYVAVVRPVTVDANSLVVSAPPAAKAVHKHTHHHHCKCKDRRRSSDHLGRAAPVVMHSAVPCQPQIAPHYSPVVNPPQAVAAVASPYYNPVANSLYASPSVPNPVVQMASQVPPYYGSPNAIMNSPNVITSPQEQYRREQMLNDEYMRRTAATHTGYGSQAYPQHNAPVYGSAGQNAEVYHGLKHTDVVYTKKTRKRVRCRRPKPRVAYRPVGPGCGRDNRYGPATTAQAPHTNAGAVVHGGPQSHPPYGPGPMQNTGCWWRRGGALFGYDQGGYPHTLLSKLGLAKTQHERIMCDAALRSPGTPPPVAPFAAAPAAAPIRY